MIAVTGTPFHNNLQDLATLFSFISPHREAVRGPAPERRLLAPANPFNDESWWADAFDPIKGTVPKMVAEIQAMSKHMLRRSTDVLEKLPPRHDTDVFVLPSLSELDAGYLQKEKQLNCLFMRFKAEMNKPAAGNARAAFLQRRRRKQMFEQMMGLMQSLRMMMLHPILGEQGRELTRKFAPSCE